MSEPLLNEHSVSKSIFAKNQTLRIFVFQLIGTFILSFGILCTQYVPPLSEQIPNPFHDVFISLSLYLAIVICAPLTGGHFNPSVTCGFYFLKAEAMGFGKFLTYILGQVAGAVLGATLAKTIFNSEIAPYTQQLKNSFTLIGDGCGEFLGAFLFIFMILIAVHPNTTFMIEPSWVQIFIPTSLFVARSFSYHVGGVNPAVVSIIQIEGIISNELPFITFIYILILDVFSICGAIAAAKFYQKVHAPTFQKVMT